MSDTSVFRNLVTELKGTNQSIVLSGKAIKVNLKSVIDDEVTLTMLDSEPPFKEFFMHIDNLIIVTKINS